MKRSVPAIVWLALASGCFSEPSPDGPVGSASMTGTTTSATTGSTSTGVGEADATTSTSGETSGEITTADDTSTTRDTDTATSSDPDGTHGPACPSPDLCPECACVAAMENCDGAMTACFAIPECAALFDCLVGGAPPDMCCTMFEMAPGVLGAYGDLRLCINPTCVGSCDGQDVLPSCE